MPSRPKRTLWLEFLTWNQLGRADRNRTAWLRAELPRRQVFNGRFFSLKIQTLFVGHS